MKNLILIRYGTFLCLLFGHKFIREEYEYFGDFDKDGLKDIGIKKFLTKNCVRCGNAIYRI